MQFIVILQSIQQFTAPMVNFVLNVVLAGFAMYCLYGGFMAFKDFVAGDGERAKNRTINIIVGVVIFAVLVVTKENITQMIAGTSIPSR